MQNQRFGSKAVDGQGGVVHAHGTSRAKRRARAAGWPPGPVACARAHVMLPAAHRDKPALLMNKREPERIDTLAIDVIVLYLGNHHCFAWE